MSPTSPATIKIARRSAIGSTCSVPLALAACVTFGLIVDRSVGQEPQGQSAEGQGVASLLVPRLGLTLDRVDSGGLRVQAVAPASPAAEAGIAAGDVIFWVNGNPSAKTDFAAATAEGFGSLKLRIFSDKTKRLSVVDVLEADSGISWVSVSELGLALISSTQLPLTVADVAKDSRAERAGIAPADIIEAVNGESVKNLGDVFAIARKAGDAPSIRVSVRQFETGAVRDVEVHVGEGFGVVGTAIANTGAFGLELEALTDRFRVSAVDAGSPAERLGFEQGDLILRIDDQPAMMYEGGFEQMRSATVFRAKPPQVIRLATSAPAATIQVECLMRVVNSMPTAVDLLWESAGGQDPQLYATLEPGAVLSQPTYLGDAWILRKHDTQELVKRLTLSELKQLVVVRE